MPDLSSVLPTMEKISMSFQSRPRKIGDVVVTNDGHPPMTIIGIDHKGVTCVWWDWDEGDTETRVFPCDKLSGTLPRKING